MPQAEENTNITSETTEHLPEKKRNGFLRGILKVVKYTLFTVLIILVSTLVLLQFPSVQTWGAKKASVWLSKELNTRVEINKVKIAFFNELSLEGVYLEDQKKDTLLYGGLLHVSIRDFSISKKYLSINLTRLKDVTAKIITYQNDSTPNFQFIADYFSSKDTVKDNDSSAFTLDYGSLILENVNLVYADRNDTAIMKGMNFSDLRLNNLYGKIKNIDIKTDTIKADVSELSFKEQSGFDLKKLNARLRISPDNIKADSLWLLTSDTYLHGSLAFEQDNFEAFNDFVNAVNMKVSLLDTTYIGTRDIAYFVPQLEEMEERVNINGKVHGTVNDLHATKFNLTWRNNTQFTGDFNLSEITDAENMYLHFDVKKLSTSYGDLSKLKVPGTPITEWKNSLSVIGPLGIINYKGKIDGLLNDIAAKGTLSTAIGNIATDAAVSNIAMKGEKLAYHGKIKTSSFNLGKLLGISGLGNITANLSVDGRGTTLKDLNAEAKGQITGVTYNNYNYSDIALSGTFKEKKFDGKVTMLDTNANVDFYGTVSFNDKYPDMDFIMTVNRFDIGKTHFVKSKDTSNVISSQIAITLTGNTLDNLSGRVNFDNTIYQVNSKVYKLSTFDLIVEQETEEKTLKLNSNIADIRMNGRYNLSTLQNSFRQYLNKYFPTLINDKKIIESKPANDQFAYRIKIKKFGIINELIMPSLMISNGSILEGEFKASTNELTLNGNSQLIEYGKYQLKNWYINTTSQGNNVMMITGVERAIISDSFYIANFRLDATSYDATSKFDVRWDNKSTKKYKGDISGSITFSQNELALEMNKVNVFIADSLWNLRDSSGSLVVDTSGVIHMNGLTFTNSSQFLNVGGVISKNPEEDLTIELTNFRLSQINPLIKSAQLKMQGTITGKARISGLLGKVIFSSDFDFNNLYINDKMLGVGKVKSIYDTHKDVVSLDGYFSKGLTNQLGNKINNIEFSGYYYPSKKENNINVEAHMKALDITMLQPYLKDIITFAPVRGGAIEGFVYVKGSVNKPEITGKLNLLGVKNLRVDYLNTYYQATGVIKIYPDRIQLGDDETANGVPDPMHFFDKDGHEATMWGNIFHDNFKISKLDFDINAKDFMVLNTSGANNPTYFGKAFVSGNVGIYGDLDYMNMDINLKTEKNTEFNIPLSGPATVSDNDYIIFVQKDTAQKVDHVYNRALSGINLNFNLEATPDANVKLIFDSKAGDVIQARGRGNIKMAVNTNGKFEMYGLYSLTDGSYLFSLENIISKKFDIVSGSTIKWTGDPLNADINISAQYNQSSSLAPFFPSDSTGLYSKPVRASVVLNMREKLLTPDITFGVQLPTVDETTRQTVMSYINNEQELNRQVFSLLLLKSFVTPLQLSNQGVGVGAGATAGRTSSEMLSNQLSNWLSQLSTNVDISVNITPEQMEVALSKQLFNDRISIDGNVGVNNTSTTQKTTNMIGDIQVEYKVYPDGKLRLKGFNKSNDNTQISTLGGPFTQGMGVFYREEFNTIDELYEKYLGWLRKKKVDPQPKS